MIFTKQLFEHWKITTEVIVINAYYINTDGSYGWKPKMGRELLEQNSIEDSFEEDLINDMYLYHEEQLLEQWNGLSDEEKNEYGEFDYYLEESDEGNDYNRKILHELILAGMDYVNGLIDQLNELERELWEYGDSLDAEANIYDMYELDDVFKNYKGMLDPVMEIKRQQWDMIFEILEKYSDLPEPGQLFNY